MSDSRHIAEMGFTPGSLGSRPLLGTRSLHRSRARTRSAFTLVELLVVIGIIAVLIAILLPALQRAQQQASTVQCLANLRSIGQAIIMYAGENKGLIVPADYSDGMNNWACVLVGARYLPDTNIENASDGADVSKGRRSALICPENSDMITRIAYGNAGAPSTPAGSPFGAPFVGWLPGTSGPNTPNHRIGLGVYRCQSTLTTRATQAWTWCDTGYGINGVSAATINPVFPAQTFQVAATVGGTAAKYNPPKITKARKSSNLVILFDGLYMNLGTNYGRVSARHMRYTRANLLFLDGHAGTFITGDVGKGIVADIPNSNSAYTNINHPWWASRPGAPRWRFDQ